MFFNTLIGCIIFLVTNISLLYTSHLLVRRFFSDAPASVRLVAIGTLFYAFVIVIFQILSPFNAITKTGVTVTCLLLAFGAHVVWGKYGDFMADVEPVKTWIRDGLNSRWAALIIMCGFVVLLSLSRALLMPPLSWDSLTYHLTLAALWVKKGTLLLFHAPFQMQNAHFPINGELFAAWLLLPFNNDLLANAMNFPVTFLGGVSCYAISRAFGLNRQEASFAPALICFSSMLYAQITTEYVDSAAFAFCSSSALFLLRYLRSGHLSDGFLTISAAGIMLGIKYSVIPVGGIIIIATTIKTFTIITHRNFLRKVVVIGMGLLLLCMLGGRQYILNSIEAGNPLYPFSITIFNKTFEGKDALEVEKEWGIKKEWGKVVDKSSLWEKEYRKFCYSDLSAGPKFLLFLLLALASLLIRPQSVPKRCWYSFYIMWLLPLIFFYLSETANRAREASGGYIVDTRYFSFYIALFTTQGLAVLQAPLRKSIYIKFVLTVLIFWDLLYININHLWRVEVLYPYLALIVPLVIIICMVMADKLNMFDLKGRIFFAPARLSTGNGITFRRWAAYIFGVFVLAIGLNLLQNYRDATRYTYYYTHMDYHNFPRDFIGGWEFLDQPGETKTIALTTDWQPPGTKWFYYPLMGRWLQNDIAYVSAKYKWEVPTWYHRGLLVGEDLSIWLHNLRRKEVEYIFVQAPWPIEYSWMRSDPEKFQLVFSDSTCNIFKYVNKDASEL